MRRGQEGNVERLNGEAWKKGEDENATGIDMDRAELSHMRITEVII